MDILVVLQSHLLLLFEVPFHFLYLLTYFFFFKCILISFVIKDVDS